MPPKTRRQSAAKASKESKATEASPQGDAAQKGARKRKRGPPAEKGEEQDNQSDSEGSKPDLTYRHWLMKSEPESRIENGVDVKFGIEDLKALPNQTSCWDGVRNYQARNFMRDMKVGQQAFFYHSNCKEPGIAGIIKIVKEAYVDHTQFEKKDVHFDPSSKPENPKWSMVDVKFEKMTKRFIPLAELKKYHLQHKSKSGPLANMALFTRARLSVQPLTAEEFDFVLSLEDADPI